jgi:hypothetical protein
MCRTLQWLPIKDNVWMQIKRMVCFLSSDIPSTP